MIDLTEIHSLLFIPGGLSERFQKALDCNADAICIDLEDSVVIKNKNTAREAALAFFERQGNRIDGVYCALGAKEGEGRF